MAGRSPNDKFRKTIESRNRARSAAKCSRTSPIRAKRDLFESRHIPLHLPRGRLGPVRKVDRVHPDVGEGAADAVEPLLLKSEGAQKKGGGEPKRNVISRDRPQPSSASSPDGSKRQDFSMSAFQALKAERHDLNHKNIVVTQYYPFFWLLRALEPLASVMEGRCRSRMTCVKNESSASLLFFFFSVTWPQRLLSIPVRVSETTVGSTASMPRLQLTL